MNVLPSFLLYAIFLQGVLVLLFYFSVEVCKNI
jgi:hypothetical protein